MRSVPSVLISRVLILRIEAPASAPVRAGYGTTLGTGGGVMGTGAPAVGSEIGGVIRDASPELVVGSDGRPDGSPLGGELETVVAALDRGGGSPRGDGSMLTADTPARRARSLISATRS
jgi:hypothetical protein